MASNNQPPAEDRLFTEENFAAELFWEKNRQKILVAAVVAVLAAIGTVWWVVSLHNLKLAAEAFFVQAKSPDAWREVIAKYPGSMPAADAMLLLAESQREQGDFDGSTATYQRFLSEYPQHPLVSGARLGLAETSSAAGKPAEAITALKTVQAAGGYAAPFAALLEGRALLREGKLAEAKEVFTKIVTTYQTSPLARLALGQVEEIDVLLPPPTPKEG